MTVFVSPVSVVEMPNAAPGVPSEVFVMMFTMPPMAQSATIEAPMPFCICTAYVASARPIQLLQYMEPEVRPWIGMPLRRMAMLSCLKPRMLSVASP